MKLRHSSTFVLTALACAVIGHAQTSTTTGAVRGMVKAKKAGPVAGAVVSARSLETGFVRTVKTDGTGTFVLSLLPVGAYEVTVTGSGLRTGRNEAVRVTMAETVIIHFDLDQSQASAVVEVVDDMAKVDTKAVNTTSTISEELVSVVPLNGRNFTDLVQLTPGAPPNSQGYRTSIEGARGIMNNLMIDGASYNSKFNGEQRGGTRIPFAFGLDSIRELQVITNPFDVQYGDASGGIINAITKNGTNEWAGGLFTQIRPGSLVANMKPVPYDPNGNLNAPAVLQRTFNTSEYGFNLGGPIIKDKLHFFVNVDYMHFSQNSMPSVSFQTTDGTQTSFNQFWGTGGMGQSVVASNAGLNLLQESVTPWADDEKHLTVMGRLDWAVNTDHKATFRVNFQNYNAKNDIWAGSIMSNRAESQNSAIKYQTLSWVAEVSSFVSSEILNEARLQFSNERRPETPNGTVSTEVDLPGFYAGNYYIDPRDTDESTTQIMDTLTWIRGDWTFKGGIDWQLLNYRNTFFQYGRGAWYFKNWDAANQWFSGTITPGVSTIQYQQSWSNTNGFVKFGEKVLANYISAENNSLLNKRLTLTAGLRYTREMYDANPNPNPKVMGLDQMPDNGSFDPRVGFALDLFGNNRTVVRGGWGLFSVTNPAQNVASAFLQNGQNALPYKVSYSAANAGLFTAGGMLSASQRIDASGHILPLDPNLLSGLPAGSIQLTLMDPQARMSQSANTMLGIEHDLGSGYVVKARGVYKRFTHLQYFLDINLAQSDPSTGSYNPSIIYNDSYPFQNNHFNNPSGGGTRPGRAIVRGRNLDLSGYGSVGLSKWDGYGSYKAFIVELERLSSDGFGFKSNLTLSTARDNNSNERSTAQSTASNPADPSDPTQQARADADIPVRFVFVGYFPKFYGVRSSVSLRYASGYPFTPRYNGDINQDGYANDPALGGRNSMRQPYQKSLDLRFNRGWKISAKVKLDTSIEIYNPFNWANQTTGNTTVDAGLDKNGVYPFGLLNVTDKKTREVQFKLKAMF